MYKYFNLGRTNLKKWSSKLFLCLVGSTSSNAVMPAQFQTAEAFGDNLTCIGIPVWHTFYVLSIRMIKTPYRGYLFLFPFKQLYHAVWKMGLGHPGVSTVASRSMDSIIPWLAIPQPSREPPMQFFMQPSHQVKSGDREGWGEEGGGRG